MLATANSLVSDKNIHGKDTHEKPPQTKLRHPSESWGPDRVTKPRQRLHQHSGKVAHGGRIYRCLAAATAKGQSYSYQYSCQGEQPAQRHVSAPFAY